LLAALIFAVHPVGVESVAWITERKNVLSAVFYLASAMAWLKMRPFATDDLPAAHSRAASRERKRKPVATPAGDVSGGASRWWYVLSFALFTCAVLSKTVTASLPAALLLVVWWKTGKVGWRDVRPLIPFFAIGLALAANTAWMERTRVGAVGPDWSFSVAERILIAGRAVWFYAAKLVWPDNLTFIYPRWQIDAGSLLQWLFPLAALTVIGVAWALRHRLGRGPLVALLFFGGTLVPALGFVNVYPMRFSFVADHFQYLASIGLIALSAAALMRHRVVARTAYVFPLVLAMLTWRQTLVYRNLETLWSDTIEKNPAAWLAHNNLGNVLLAQGDADGAVDRYRVAVQLKPDYYEARGNLGAALLRRGAVEEARVHTDEALQIAPTYVPALVNRAGILLSDARPNEAIVLLQDVLRQEAQNGEALNVLGSALAMRSDVANAQAAFEAALRFRPDLVSARVNLARLLLRVGRTDESAAQLDQAILLAPGDADARNTKGLVLVARGRPDEAIAYFRALSQALPRDASTHFHLGTLLSQSGAVDEAIAEFQTAIRLNPFHAEARNNLGIAHLIAERYLEAVAQFTEALRLRRNNPEAHNNLAYALVRLGRSDEAIAHLEEALRLRPSYAEARAQLRSLRR
jgi:tetratricopeptide (TPR) repeat protein